MDELALYESRLELADFLVEALHDDVGATTLFATHHHDLTAMADDLDGVVNRHFSATRDDGEVTFEHDLKPGPATASYGVEVARMAGVPEGVVSRAREHLEADRPSSPSGDPAAPDDALAAALAEVDVANTTPLEALETLNRLTELAAEPAENE